MIEVHMWGVTAKGEQIHSIKWEGDTSNLLNVIAAYKAQNPTAVRLCVDIALPQEDNRRTNGKHS